VIAVLFPFCCVTSQSERDVRGIVFPTRPQVRCPSRDARFAKRGLPLNRALQNPKNLRQSGTFSSVQVRVRVELSKLVGICALLLLLIAAFSFSVPVTSARISLALHGHPFARVVPKDQMNVLSIVPTDSFASRGVAYARERPIGWICSSFGSFPQFVPFGAAPDFGSLPGLGENCLFLVLWMARWIWLLAAVESVSFGGEGIGFIAGSSAEKISA
jgi:hypothetical protein